MIRVSRVSDRGVEYAIAARMAYPEFQYRWTWQLRSSPEALWPLVADTNRFNRDTGVPNVERHAANLSSLSHILGALLMVAAAS